MRAPTASSDRLCTLLLSLLLLGGLGSLCDRAAAQEEGIRGIQLEASGLWTTLAGDVFPFDETGWGGAAGLHHRWPGGLSLGVVGMYARPQDLSLAATNPRRRMEQWGASGELRYRLSRMTPLRPYLGARAGWTRLEDRGDPATSGHGVTYGVTVGTEIWPSDRLGFRLAATGGGLSVANYFQQGGTDTGLALTLEAGISVFTGSIRRIRDADGDGVRDGEDDCAGTPRGVQVDRWGCAQDADRDGVPDHRDECVGSTAGARVDSRGCAVDGDMDGIPEGLDSCPRTPEGVEVDDRGCALDADGDGVADDVDACPGTPEGTPVTGEGCPRDTDGDGVHDGADRCPNTPEDREVDEAGCSRIEAGLERGRLRLGNIHFAFGSAQLDRDSRRILDEVGRALLDRSDVRVQIQGHTDSVGSDAVNLRLSRERAEAVRSYLLQRYSGLDADRLEAVGLGESQPVASNGTAQGRTLNRRVEFVVLEGGGP